MRRGTARTARAWFFVFVGALAGACDDAGSASDTGDAGAGDVSDQAGDVADGSGDAADLGSDEADLPDPASDGTLGARCSNADACDAPLICVHPDDNVDPSDLAPAHGLCTASCGDDSECEALAGGSRCTILAASRGPERYCAEPCTPSSVRIDLPAVAPVPSKCHGRPEMACSVSSYCQPTCNANEDCPASQFCDPLYGGCTLDPASRVDLGTDDCDTHFSVSTEQADFICTARCTLGAVPSCEWTSEAEAQPPSACAPWFSGAVGAGDAGVCLQTCDCDDDCTHPDLRCVQVSGFYAQALGRAGLCFPPEAGDGIACP